MRLRSKYHFIHLTSAICHYEHTSNYHGETRQNLLYFKKSKYVSFICFRNQMDKKQIMEFTIDYNCYTPTVSLWFQLPSTVKYLGVLSWICLVRMITLFGGTCVMCFWHCHLCDAMKTLIHSTATICWYFLGKIQRNSLHSRLFRVGKKAHWARPRPKRSLRVRELSQARGIRFCRSRLLANAQMSFILQDRNFISDVGTGCLHSRQVPGINLNDSSGRVGGGREVGIILIQFTHTWDVYTPHLSIKLKYFW